MFLQDHVLQDPVYLDLRSNVWVYWHRRSTRLTSRRRSAGVAVHSLQNLCLSRPYPCRQLHSGHSWQLSKATSQPCHFSQDHWSLLRALLFESSSRRSPRVTRRRSLGLRYHLNRTVLIMRNRSVHSSLCHFKTESREVLNIFFSSGMSVQDITCIKQS